MLEHLELIQPDILLLDISMPEMSGLEVASLIAKLAAPPVIIFCTAFEQHALEAFNLKASGYLLKPVRKEELERVLNDSVALNRAQLKIQGEAVVNQGGKSLMIESTGGVELLPLKSISHFQVEDNHVFAFIEERSILT